MAASPLEPHRRLISRLYIEGRSDDDIRESLGRRGLDATVFEVRSRLEAWHLVPAPSPVVSTESDVVSSAATLALDPLVGYQQNHIDPYTTEECMAATRLGHFDALVVDVRNWLRVIDDSPHDTELLDDGRGLPQVVREPRPDLPPTRAVARSRRRHRRRHRRLAARDPTRPGALSPRTDDARAAPPRLGSSRPPLELTSPNGSRGRSYMNGGENAGALERER